MNTRTHAQNNLAFWKMVIESPAGTLYAGE